MEPEDQPLPPAYQGAIRAEVRDVLRQSGKQIAEEQGYTKRDVLQMGGFVALGALMGTGGLAAMAGPAAADSQGEIGTQADPLTTGFFAALNAGDGQQLTNWETGFNTHAATKSSAYTTDGEHFIDVDTSAAGVTITLATADTVRGHYVVIRQNGANDVTIDTEGAETIDGSSSLTLQHDQAVVTLWSDGSNWFSDQFTDTVDVRSLVADSGTITSSNKDIPGVPSTSTGVSPSFGTWRQVSSSRPAGVLAEIKVVTDGSTNGFVRLEVDESGGTTADYNPIVAHEDSASGGSNVQEFTTTSFLLPAGAQYRFVNSSDPTALNLIEDVREFTL